MRIVTRCTSREQFVTMFRRFCNPTSCFIPSLDTRPIGIATAFSIRLADGTPLLRGQGVVLDAWSHADNPFKRPGVHLGIHRLNEDSTDVFEELLVPRSAAVSLPIAAQLRMLRAPAPAITLEELANVAALDTPTVQMPPLELLTNPLPANPLPANPLPANPLTYMTDALLDAFVECTMYEDAIPDELQSEATIPNAATPETVAAAAAMPRSRESIATLLGVMPLAAPRVSAAPTLVQTELVDRVQTLPSIVIREDPPWWRAAFRRCARFVGGLATRLRGTGTRHRSRSAPSAPSTPSAPSASSSVPRPRSQSRRPAGRLRPLPRPPAP